MLNLQTQVFFSVLISPFPDFLLSVLRNLTSYNEWTGRHEMKNSNTGMVEREFVLVSCILIVPQMALLARYSTTHPTVTARCRRMAGAGDESI